MGNSSRSRQSASTCEDEGLAELEAILNYKFNNKSLLEEATTHPSMNDTKSYQRLEFLGDSVLSYLVTKHLYWRYPELDEGKLTSLRSRNVDNEKFARASVKHKFYDYLRMQTQPELERNVENFVKAIEDEPESESLHGGDFDPPKVLADILESIAGAVLIDSGHSVDKVWEVFMPLLEPLVTPETLQQYPVDELQKLCQKPKKDIEYTYSQNGNKWRVEVLIDGEVVAIGEDQKKGLAQKAAVKDALNKLKEMLNLL